MKGSSIISGVHNLRKAYDSFQDCIRANPGTKGEKILRNYNQKINWIANDLITIPYMPIIVREGIKAEWNCDVFAVDAISEKAALLNPQQREVLEYILDYMLKGEQISIEHIKK